MEDDNLLTSAHKIEPHTNIEKKSDHYPLTNIEKKSDHYPPVL